MECILSVTNWIFKYYLELPGVKGIICIECVYSYPEKLLPFLCWELCPKFACCLKKNLSHWRFSSTGTTWMTLWGQTFLCATSPRILHVPVSTSHQESWISHYQNHQHGSASFVCLRRTSRMYASGYSGFTRDQRWGTHLQNNITLAVMHIWCWGFTVFWMTTRAHLTHSFVSVTSEKLGTPVGKSLNCRSAPKSCATATFVMLVCVCMVHLCSHWMDCYGIWYYRFLLNCVNQIQVWLKWDRN